MRAHSNDAGIDVFSPCDFGLKPGEFFMVPIDVAFEPPEGEMLLVQTKSGIGKRGLSTSIGATVIDEGYRGNCHVQMYNFGSETQFVKKGDKIAQLIQVPVIYSELEQVDELSETERGEGRFGSSGTKYQFEGTKKA
jgi:dUTP pyrophosphatase